MIVVNDAGVEEAAGAGALLFAGFVAHVHDPGDRFEQLLPVNALFHRHGLLGLFQQTDPVHDRHSFIGCVRVGQGVVQIVDLPGYPFVQLPDLLPALVRAFLVFQHIAELVDHFGRGLHVLHQRVNELVFQ